VRHRCSLEHIPTLSTLGKGHMSTKYIPEGYHSVTPSICVEGGQKLIDFLKEVFGAQERMRMGGPGEKIMHAEFNIGDSVIMVADTMPGCPTRLNSLYVYVKDVDAAYKRALQAGATSEREPQDMFYGDRSAAVIDAFGNFWGIATHVEDVSPGELKKRAEAFQKQSAAS
jgi:PhnB protein